MKTKIIKLNELDVIKEDVDKMAKIIANDLAKKAESSLINISKNIIKEFYKSHSNTQYRRKKGLFNAIDSHYINHIKDNRKRASVIVSSNSMDDHYRISKNNVFDLMWIHGVRGLPRVGKNPLDDDFAYWRNGKLVNYGFQGQQWINPYWSGESDPYNNVFRDSVSTDEYDSPKLVPNRIMVDFVNNWGKTIGMAELNRIVNKL